jgi:hypothetical protein
MNSLRVTATPNHALQRTAPGVTACAPTTFAPAAFPHRLRRPPQSLSLGSFGIRGLRGGCKPEIRACRVPRLRCGHPALGDAAWTFTVTSIKSKIHLVVPPFDGNPSVHHGL